MWSVSYIGEKKHKAQYRWEVFVRKVDVEEVFNKIGRRQPRKTWWKTLMNDIELTKDTAK